MSNQIVLYVREETKKKINELSEYYKDSMSGVIKTLVDRSHKQMLKRINKLKEEPRDNSEDIKPANNLGGRYDNELHET